jgi:hypothetical protein
MGTDERYEYIENEGTEEELEQWMIDEDQSYCVIVPSGVSVRLSDGIADIPLSQGATGEMDGNDYVAYYASAMTVKILREQRFDTIITLTKN